MKSILPWIYVILAFTKLVECADRIKDKVLGLPDCAPLPSNWYSGYLGISESKALHYVLVESLDSP